MARRFAGSVNAWPLALLTILPCLWWWPLLVGYLPDFMDTVTLQYPMRYAAARQLHAGTLPLWLPEMMSGTPLAANPEVAVWYPLNWPFFLLPSPFSYGFIVVIHYILAGWGSYLLARQLRCRAAPALVAGLTLQFGAFMISHVALLPLVFAMPWVPLLFFAVERDVVVRSTALVTRPSLAVAGLFSLQLLAGASQFTFYTSLALPVYWLGRAAGEQGWRGVLLTLPKGALAAALALALAAVQVLPTLDFLQESERGGGLSTEKLQGQALNGTYRWRALIGFTGETIEDTDTINAIGAGALLLVPLAFLRRRTAFRAWPLLLIGIAAYLLALGTLVPLWGRLVPLYESFHAPRRALLLWSAVGPVLAALGAQNLHAYLVQRKSPKWLFPALLALLLAPNVWMLPRLERAFTTTERFRPDPSVARALGTGRYLTIDPTLNYAHGSRNDYYGRALLPNLGAWHGLPDAQGYNALVLRRYGIARTLASTRSGNFYPSHGAFLTDPASPVLRLLGVNFLIGRFDLFDPGRVIPGASIDDEAVRGLVQPLHDDEYWPLWKYREERPIAWIPAMVQRADSAEAALRLAASQANPYERAYADAEHEPYLPPVVPTEPRALRLHDEDARTVRVDLVRPLDQEAVVVAAIPWTKDWQGTALPGGQHLASFPVNAVNTAVLLPAGSHALQLRYSPRSFWHGLWISLAGALLLAGLWQRSLRHRPI